MSEDMKAELQHWQGSHLFPFVVNVRQVRQGWLIGIFPLTPSYTSHG